MTDHPRTAVETGAGCRVACAARCTDRSETLAAEIDGVAVRATLLRRRLAWETNSNIS